MRIKTQIRTSFLFLAFSAVVLSGQALALEEGALDESRPTIDLQADVREAVDRDTDVANTALTFNNPGATTAIVVCKAFDGRGNVLGTKSVHIAPNGLRYLRASDIANGTDFVGSAECKSRTRVDASAIFLAPGALTNLNVRHRVRRALTTVHFPLVATY